MHIIVDILLLLFVGFMLYWGIKKGFMGTTFTLVTAILRIALAGGIPFAIMFFILQPLGIMNDLRMGLIGTAEALNFIWALFRVDVLDGALYLGYAALGIPLFIVFYFFAAWLEGQFLRFCKWVRKKCVFFRILGSFLGGAINLAIAGGLVLGLFWVFSIVDGSGLFTNANETIRASYLSSLVYEYNPIAMVTGMGHGSMAETVKSFLTGSFLFG